MVFLPLLLTSTRRSNNSNIVSAFVLSNNKLSARRRINSNRFAIHVSSSSSSPSLLAFNNKHQQQSHTSRLRQSRKNLHTVLSLQTTRSFTSTVSELADENNDNNVNVMIENTINEMKRTSSQPFEVCAPYEPMGDQPKAIEQLLQQLQNDNDSESNENNNNNKFSVLQGITGTGKTFVISHVIAKYGKPTLILCHNKTLAAQLARELRTFLPKNSVELFVSFYNHYVPESFIETTGKHVSKKSSINDDIDCLRHRATRALLERNDVVIIASVSCIFGLGLPKEYLQASTHIKVGDDTSLLSNAIGKCNTIDKCIYNMKEMFQKTMLYTEPEKKEDGNDDDDLERGNFQLLPAIDNNGKQIIQISLWPPHERFPMGITIGRSNNGDDDDNNDENDNDNFLVTSIQKGTINGLTNIESIRIFPAKHHVTSEEQLNLALQGIEDELREQIKKLNNEGKEIEAIRLQDRVVNDLYMIREQGYCNGMENYSRHFAGRSAGDTPDTLLDYFNFSSSNNNNNDKTKKKKNDWLLVVDESHVTISQLKAMYAGDRSRKLKLVKHGFRLPSALDNRPLMEDEFWNAIPKCIFASATPSKREVEWTYPNKPIEMQIRPTFVPDPIIYVRSKSNQLSDLLNEIRTRTAKNERTLALTVTKRDAEDLALFLLDNDIRASYIHSDLKTKERSDVLKELQNGDIDCLVGINLLREGLDLPQVSLCAILNADYEGFLRSETALLQIVGRAARNVNGEAIFYADRITNSMKRCMDETNRRRQRQIAFNEQHGRESRSTKGSTTMSIFDLLHDEIEKEKESLRAINPSRNNGAAKLEESTLKPDGAILLSEFTKDGSEESVVTDHIPSKPGVYFWKDESNNILYIGVSKKLRSRVKSYLRPNANHSDRIRLMIKKAVRVDFILTPSDRDAIILESNLIKHHQPPFNVLLKDDQSYPYICASIGDSYPRFYPVPYRYTGQKEKSYRYFGPYPHFNEINDVIDGIEDTYDLRKKSFEARYGSDFTKDEYNDLFDIVINEVFDDDKATTKNQQSSTLVSMRAEYEEAGLLFDCEDNECRDVVAIGLINSDNHDDKTRQKHQQLQQQQEAVVHVVQLRSGLIAGSFSYECTLPIEHDHSIVLQTVLERQHYPLGVDTSYGKFSFFPDEILLQHPPHDLSSFRRVLRTLRKNGSKQELGISQGLGTNGNTETKNKTKTLRIKEPAKRGKKKQTDARAMDFAKANAEQIALQKSLERKAGAVKTSIDGTAAHELASLLKLKKLPHRIECYDISHTQGDFPVGSRVVFIDGEPAKHLYRRFNIKTVDGVDDYKSLEEVLERRFKHVWIDDYNDSKKNNDYDGTVVEPDDQWSIPDLVVVDGGVGQLSAAIKGMARANIFPLGIDSLNTDEIDTEESDKNNKSDIIEEIVTEKNGQNSSTWRTGKSVAVCALSKNQEEVYSPGSNGPLNDKADTPALLLLRSLRDESHRFALKNHRRRRSAVLKQ